jgi:hypothetical protein
MTGQRRGSNSRLKPTYEIGKPRSLTPMHCIMYLLWCWLLMLPGAVALPAHDTSKASSNPAAPLIDGNTLASTGKGDSVGKVHLGITLPISVAILGGGVLYIVWIFRLKQQQLDKQDFIWLMTLMTSLSLGHSLRSLLCPTMEVSSPSVLGSLCTPSTLQRTIVGFATATSTCSLLYSVASPSLRRLPWSLCLRRKMGLMACQPRRKLLCGKL